MMKSIKYSVSLLLGIGLSLLVGISLLQAQSPTSNNNRPATAENRIEPAVLAQLRDRENAQVPVLIRLTARADLRPAQRLADPLARRSSMVATLQATAAASQDDVLRLLQQAEANGQAAEIRSLWIINAVAAQASQPTIEALAALPGVEEIQLDERITLETDFDPAEVVIVPDEVEWGIQRVQADQVWRALGIDGRGVVVANMDSGVDYLHPDLQPRYRGYLGPDAPPIHRGNWFDATGTEARYPVDSSGHGTHTMGTIVGENGIGVAPGATWIAVRTFNSAGQGLESWIHAGFEWLLAPDGDPALAPDVVNNSWSNSNSRTEIFSETVTLLQEAGIIQVFSAGNYGPSSGSVGAPGSYAEVLTVGATDAFDLIAAFSARGPSPWSPNKPELTAPGVQVQSAYPGGSYIRANGTSMAAPHVTGAVALLLQADPSLRQESITHVLTRTASPLGATTPNPDYGWGQLRIYDALLEVMPVGRLRGQVVDQTTLAPIPYATVNISLRGRPERGELNTPVDAAGRYERGLQPDTYEMTATAFGYSTQRYSGLSLLTDTVLTRDFGLVPLPTGTLSGRISSLENAQPLSATIEIANTPLRTESNPLNGAYEIDLPAGQYTLTVRSPGHRLAVVPNLSIEVGQTTLQSLNLFTSPNILLVDSGAWYNDSRSSYIEEALTANRYIYDLYRVTQAPDPAMTSTLFSPYDVVVWSAPRDSPGRAGADLALRHYLSEGGQLLLSGQNIAQLDGGGQGFYPYYVDYLQGSFFANTDSISLSGETGSIFDGLSTTLNDADSAENQTSPESLNIINPELAQSILRYDNERVAAYAVGQCAPYRAVVLGFGLEGIDSETRQTMLARSLDWFQVPPRESGLNVYPADETRITRAGESITHTITVRNEAQIGPPQTIDVTVSSRRWPVEPLQSTLVLTACSEAHLDFRVTVPPDTPRHISDTVRVTAGSREFPAATTTITRITKTPAPLLLVDDDRWYQMEGRIAGALQANNMAFDVWSVQSGPRLGSPPLAVLRDYPLVYWFTSYDWFSPLTAADERNLARYLTEGGRLALTSQEYLLKADPQQRFARTYLGVAGYRESITTTVGIGIPGSPIGDGLGTYALTFPEGYQNWTDTLSPTQDALPAIRNPEHQFTALTYQGGQTQTWHTAFFGFGPELLPDEPRSRVVGQTVGWLSWLGQSTVTASTDQAYSGEIITYTLTLHNNGRNDIANAHFRGTFPAYLFPIADSFGSGPLQIGSDVRWNGPVARGETLTFTYRARVLDIAPLGAPATHRVQIGYDLHQVTFERRSQTRLNAPDWISSTLTARPNPVRRGNLLTYTLSLRNRAAVDVPALTITTRVPPHLSLQPVGPGSLVLPTGGPFGPGFSPSTTTRRLTWQTALNRNETLNIGYSARVLTIPYPFTTPIIFQLDDGHLTHTWHSEVLVRPVQMYLPLALRGASRNDLLDRTEVQP